jgi:DNA-binding transcriptional MerR regulator
MNVFTIKDLEYLSGIKAHTIRIWEQRYHFLCPQRSNTNIRYYSNDELKTILNIALLNKYGFKISHIDRMSAEEIRQKVLLLDDVAAVQERLINELVEEMVDLDMEKFEQILNKYIAVKGVERTVTQIIFPFLEKIGILWQTGHINPAQEHLVSNLIRQKLMAAIETCNSPVKLDKTVLLFLPEGEYHELGLLYLYYLLKNKGARAIYLGTNVPLADVEYVIKLKKPDMVFVHLTGPATGFQLDKFLSQAERKFESLPIIISGQVMNSHKRRIPANVRFLQSLGSVTEYLHELSLKSN